jgi:tRNA (cmo5U34)-methyltransferase
MLRNDDIIGGFGLIDNDFMVRDDLCPWFCALYIEPAERGHELGSKLLAHGRLEAARSGFAKIYLNTDHVGYYEKYGWQYIGDFAHLSGVDTRVYEADTIHSDCPTEAEQDVHQLCKPEPMGDFFDARADVYDEHMLSELGIEEDYKKLGAYIPKTDDAIHILDVGCGTGIELGYIWKQAPNAHITCVDVSRAMLDLLVENHSDSLGHITIIEASYIDWPFPESAFDIVVSNMTMHHLWPQEKVEVYRNILGALKPGGVYIEGDFIVDDIAVKQYAQRYEAITVSLPNKAKAGEYHIDIPCSLEVQKELLSEAGFNLVEILDREINHGNGAILRAVRQR